MQTRISTTTLDPAGTERSQRLAQELGVESFGLNLMRLGPGARGRVHRHASQEEVYVVLEGTLTIETSADDRIELVRGQAARVAPEVRRRLVNRGPERVLLLALGGASPYVRGDGIAFRDWDDPEGRPPQEVPMPEDLPPEAR